MLEFSEKQNLVQFLKVFSTKEYEIKVHIKFVISELVFKGFNFLTL